MLGGTLLKMVVGQLHDEVIAPITKNGKPPQVFWQSFTKAVCTTKYQRTRSTARRQEKRNGVRPAVEVELANYAASSANDRTDVHNAKRDKWDADDVFDARVRASDPTMQTAKEHLRLRRDLRTVHLQDAAAGEAPRRERNGPKLAWRKRP